MTATLTTVRLLLVAAFLACCFTGCKSTPTVDHLGDGGQASAPATVVHGLKIVHVDTRARIATIRPDGSRLEGEFYLTVSPRGQETGVVKLAPMAPGTVLRTADILEGRPSVNDRVVEAGPGESERLAALYPEADETIE